MNGIICSMEEDGHSTREIAPIIHMTKSLAFDTDSNDRNEHTHSRK